MDTNAKIVLTSAIVSVISLLATILFSVWAAISAGRSRKIALGEAESTIRADIQRTRQVVGALAIQIAAAYDGKRSDQLRAEDKRRIEPLELAFKEVVEDRLNAHEAACSRYRDNKIDRERFKKTYFDDVGNLCRSKDDIHKEFLHPADVSRFQNIWFVYREWHIRET